MDQEPTLKEILQEIKELRKEVKELKKSVVPLESSSSKQQPTVPNLFTDSSDIKWP